MIDYIDDWRKRLRGRLYLQFKTVTDWQTFSDMIAAQTQDLEDAGQALLSMIDIDAAEGAQLDLVGRVVKQSRLGAADAVYRMYLKAKILVNRSGGTIPNLYAVFNALFGALGYEARTHPVKTFTFTIDTVITSAQAYVASLFLRDAKESGARGILYWQESVDAELFTFDVGPGFDVGKLAGATDV